MLKKKEKNNRKRGLLPKLIGSFVVAAALFGVLIGVEKNILSDYEKETVVLCRTEVPKGIKITEENVGKLFYMYEVDATLIDETCVKNTTDLIDTVTGRTLSAHEMVRKGSCTKEAEIYGNYQNPAEGSFAVNEAGDMVSGTIRKGDRVDIAVVNKDTLEYDVMLKNVYVLESFTNNGEKVTADMEGTAATMLTIVEEKDNLAKFYSAMETGNVIVTRLENE